MGNRQLSHKHWNVGYDYFVQKSMGLPVIGCTSDAVTTAIKNIAFVCIILLHAWPYSPFKRHHDKVHALSYTSSTGTTVSTCMNVEQGRSEHSDPTQLWISSELTEQDIPGAVLKEPFNSHVMALHCGFSVVGSRCQHCGERTNSLPGTTVAYSKVSMVV